MVIAFTKNSLVRIDTCNFELS